MVNTKKGEVDNNMQRARGGGQQQRTRRGVDNNMERARDQLVNFWDDIFFGPCMKYFVNIRKQKKELDLKELDGDDTGADAETVAAYADKKAGKAAWERVAKLDYVGSLLEKMEEISQSPCLDRTGVVLRLHLSNGLEPCKYNATPLKTTAENLKEKRIKLEAKYQKRLELEARTMDDGDQMKEEHLEMKKECMEEELVIKKKVCEDVRDRKWRASGCQFLDYASEEQKNECGVADHQFEDCKKEAEKEFKQPKQNAEAEKKCDKKINKAGVGAVAAGTAVQVGVAGMMMLGVKSVIKAAFGWGEGGHPFLDKKNSLQFVGHLGAHGLFGDSSRLCWLLSNTLFSVFTIERLWCHSLASNDKRYFFDQHEQSEQRFVML